MKKTILFLFYRECSFLPPFTTIVESFCDDYSIKIISNEKEGGLEELRQRYKGKDITFLCDTIQEDPNTLSKRIRRRLPERLRVYSRFHKEAVKLLEQTKYDILWVIHEESLHEFRDVLRGKKYVVSLYELNDHRKDFLESIKDSIKEAQDVIVPEYNRACILRVWLQLKKTPTVIPNKPLGHPLNRNIENPYSKELEGKKIILYQGYIQRSRNIDALCEACKDMPDYKIVVMGGGDKTYIEELKSKYLQIMHISFVTPPNHLYITSYARFGIVKYDFVWLNAIYCAPNKTWEYTGFGIPVLCHNIPGLEYTIGKYDAGVCTDMDDKDCIRAAIEKMDANYDYYSQNALTFYNSFDIKSSLYTIADKY